MGKGNKPSLKITKHITDVNSAGIPLIDEEALSALTTKIEQDFRKSKTPQKTKNQNDPVSRDEKTAVPSRGTKRDSHGNAKTPQQGAQPNNRSSNQKAGGKNKGKEDDSRAVLLQEILALGGTEEDLEWVASTSSDDGENDMDASSAPVDKSFQKDLANFVAGLGIAGAIDINASQSDAQEDADDDTEVSSQTDILASFHRPAESQFEGKESRGHLSEPGDIHTIPNKSNCLLFEARPDWHAVALPDLPDPETSESTLYREAMKTMKEYALSLLDSDNKAYSSKHLSSSSSHRFLSTIMSSGTLSDKVSALTLVIQESPVHTTKSFENLLALAKKRSRGQAVIALGALKDLLGVGVVLPPDRRLRSFASQPGLLGALQADSIKVWRPGQKLPGGITKIHLISWAYEDWLKESYFDMLKVLEGWCNDEIEYARSRAVTYVYDLLKEKPEQESNLLRLLVNKLGDPDKKIASRTSYLLLQLQVSHPMMKPIIIRSVENELLLRPGQSSHAKYYAINTLNQTVLSAKEESVAQKLLSIYFDLFVSLLKKPDPQKASAGPIVNSKGQIQGGGGAIGKKARAKLIKEEEAKQANEETVEKMISAVLTGVNRAFPFAKTDDLTLEKHMDTLFRITHSSNFNTSIQALMLIEQLATSKYLAVDRFYRTLYESLLDPRLITSSKHTLYLNLLFRALKADLNIKRVKAFAKRMLQVITLHQPPFICGVIYLLGELEGFFPGLKSLLNDPEETSQLDEEVFRDANDTTTTGAQMDDNARHHQHPTSKVTVELYDGKKRDPEHSNAYKSCLWESIPFLSHFHPSVSVFASRLLADEKMPPKPDLSSHTLAHFLDRFVYRNAKAAAGGPRGNSIMQPLTGGDSRGALVSNGTSQLHLQPVNSEAFWRRKAEDIAVDEVFFHKYFSQIGKTKQAAREKNRTKYPGRSENDEAGSGEDEDEIWQALVDSRPEIEGNSDDDEDLEMFDLEDSDGDSSGAGVDIEGSGSEVEGSSDLETERTGLGDPEEEEQNFMDSDNDSPSEFNELIADELETVQESKIGGKSEETSGQKRRKLKNLPTFASVEDYADMLDDDTDEDF